MAFNISQPSIRGRTDDEKIDEIIQYLSYFASSIESELNSIDSTDLSQELNEKINKIITEHQDLSAYATRSYVNKLFGSV